MAERMSPRTELSAPATDSSRPPHGASLMARQHLSWCGRHTTSHTNNPAANTNAQGQRATPSTCSQAGSVGFLGSGSARLASAHGASDLDMPV